MNKVLVTGGCGYIGSHTIVALLERGFEVISIDSFERGQKYIPERVQQITGKKFFNYQINLSNLRNTRQVIMEHKDLAGIIHFAALKSVSESVEKPLKYYGNNLISLMNLLLCVREFGISNLIFSSSSAVYGDLADLPVKESSPITGQTSPYGRTKYFGEKMIEDVLQVYDFRTYLLRYFNPAGTHDSALIGEPIEEAPTSLVPSITRTAAGKQNQFIVNGGDYPTRDGSCIRDYVHVMDIAEAHVAALESLLAMKKEQRFLDVINLGSGRGVTVLEMVNAFQKATGISLPVKIGPRRSGDAMAVYADTSRAASVLGWKPRRSLEEMMQSAWKWEQANQKSA